jgi:ribonuclease HI
LKTVDIYTDGACKGNPGAGGWSAILVFGGREKELFGGEAVTTNNRMELTAAIEGLKALKEQCNVNLYSDSQYLVNAINKGWLENWKKKGWRKADKSAVLNDDLWKELDELLSFHNVEFIWVRGHDGHEYNERCDELASGYAEKLRTEQ